MLNGAPRVAADASDVRDPRLRHVEAPSTRDLEAEVEVDVLEVAEVALVEAADADQPVAPVERRGAGGPEDLARRRGWRRRAHCGGPARRCRRRGRRRRRSRAAPTRRPARSCSRTTRTRDAARPRRAATPASPRSAKASGFRRATSSQSSSMWIPTLLAAAKPTFRSSGAAARPPDTWRRLAPPSRRSSRCRSRGPGAAAVTERGPSRARGAGARRR